MAKVCKRGGIELDVNAALILQDISKGQISSFKEVLSYLNVQSEQDALSEFYKLSLVKKSSLK